MTREEQVKFFMEEIDKEIKKEEAYQKSRTESGNHTSAMLSGERIFGMQSIKNLFEFIFKPTANGNRQST